MKRVRFVPSTHLYVHIHTGIKQTQGLECGCARSRTDTPRGRRKRYVRHSLSLMRNTRKKGRNVVVRIRVSRKEEDKIDSVVVRNRNRREMNGYWPPPAEIRRLGSGHVWIGGAREAR